MTRRACIVLVLLAMVGLAALVPAKPSHVAAFGHPAKKVCKTVTKKVHGKKKKVKVCTAAKPTSTPTATATPTPTLTPTITPTPTNTPEPPNTVSSTPAFPGAAPGGFIAGLSTSVTLPPSLVQGRFRPHDSLIYPGGINTAELSVGLDPPPNAASQLVSVSFEVADATGFTPNQTICMRPSSTANFKLPPLFLGKLCGGRIESLSPGTHSVEFPHGARVTFHVNEWGAGFFREHYEPRNWVLSCDNLTLQESAGSTVPTVGPSDSTVPTVGQIATFPITVGNAQQMVSGQVTSVSNGLISVAGVEDLPLHLDVFDPNAAAQLVPAGTPIKISQGTVSGNFRYGNHDALLQVVGLPSQMLTGLIVWDFSASGVKVIPSQCSDCTTQIGMQNDLSFTTITGNITPSSAGLLGLVIPNNPDGTNPQAGLYPGAAVEVTLRFSSLPPLSLQMPANPL